MTNESAPTRPAGLLPDTLATVIGAVGQLVVGYFTLAAIGLIGVPVWGIGVLAGGWLAASAALVYLARRRPLLTMVVPVANALVLWAVQAAGGAWLGWAA